APTARAFHTAVWTGIELIIWGGQNSVNVFSTGSLYNPTTDSRTATTTVDAPSARSNHTAVWTGSEMIVWAEIQRIPVEDTIPRPIRGRLPAPPMSPLREIFIRQCGLVAK